MTAPAPSFQTDLNARLTRPGNRLSRMAPGARRGLVVAAAAGAGAAIALPWVLPQPWVPVASGALLVMILAGAVLDVSTRTIFQLPGAVLDERARRRREHAAYLAIRISGPLLLLVAVAACLAAGQAGGWTVTADRVLPAAVGLAFAVAGLPIWVLAWTEPAWDADEEVLPDATVPAGPFPWARVLGQGLSFGVVITVLGLAGFGGIEEDPVRALVRGLVSAVLFTVLVGLWTRWVRRRL